MGKHNMMYCCKYIIDNTYCSQSIYGVGKYGVEQKWINSFSTLNDMKMIFNNFWEVLPTQGYSLTLIYTNITLIICMLTM
jgi:hypothetical protein